MRRRSAAFGLLLLCPVASLRTVPQLRSGAVRPIKPAAAAAPMLRPFAVLPALQMLRPYAVPALVAVATLVLGVHAAYATEALPSLSLAASKVCEEPYGGILPCSSGVGGNLFLMAAFGFVLFSAAGLISEGSELLLEVLDPGIVGGLLLPTLGAFPDAVIVLCSALGGTAAEAQEEVAVGLGVLAGSSVMLLTVAWGGSLIAGRCDLEGPNGTAVDRTLSAERRLSLGDTGVTTDEETKSGALIMAISCLPYLIVQVPLIDGHPAEGPEAALVGACACAVGFVAYAAYSVASPWLQSKRIDDARLRYAQARAVRRITSSAKSFGGVLNPDGSIDDAKLQSVFAAADHDDSGGLSSGEVEALLVGMSSERGGPIEKGEINTWMREFDTDESGCINPSEFRVGMTRWVAAMRTEGCLNTVEAAASDVLGRAPQAEEPYDSEEEAEELTPAQIYRKSALLLACGMALVAAFADPMVGAIDNFAAATHWNAFFVAFVITPFASNASEVVSSFFFASKKRRRTISLTFAQIYGGIIMNNTLVLGIFLALVYARGLTWDFSAEVSAILAIIGGMSVVGYSRTTFPTAFAPPVLALYPAVLVGIVGLEQGLGWH